MNAAVPRPPLDIPIAIMSIAFRATVSQSVMADVAVRVDNIGTVSYSIRPVQSVKTANILISQSLLRRNLLSNFRGIQSKIIR